MIAEPMDVMGLGTMAVFADPTGAVFGIWQPGTFAGAELVNEPGAFGWNELNTRDLAAAKEFYGAVFGWGFEDAGHGRDGHLHDLVKVGEAIGRRHARHRPAGVPDEVPPHWLVYFAVEDTDATVEKAKAGGGGVMIGRSTSRSAASRSSPTRTAPSSP